MVLFIIIWDKQKVMICWQVYNVMQAEKIVSMKQAYDVRRREIGCS